jgi:hypothetical protein
MTGLYEGLFRDVHAATGRMELDGRPSLLSTLLILSVTQLLNLLSIAMTVEAMLMVRLPISKLGFVAVELVFLTLNYLFSRRLGIDAGEPASRAARWGSPGVLYVLFSILAFGCAAIFMNNAYSQ